MSVAYRYHHAGIPTTSPVEGMTRLMSSGSLAPTTGRTPFGIQWMCYDTDCPVPPLVARVAHVAFEVDDLAEALAGKR